MCAQSRKQDIVDLTHPNGGQCYLWRGAQRDTATQLAAYEQERDKAQRRADFFQGSIDSLKARQSASSS